jgi:hypothetical protein
MAKGARKTPLTLKLLTREAQRFAAEQSKADEPLLFGVTDGKAVGTHVEQKFCNLLAARYEFGRGSAAKGIDFPELDVDIKVTSIKQPQSSCPFRSARQKVYGLGYDLLLFVYEKVDDQRSQTARLNIRHAILIDRGRTADYQTTTGLRRILENNGNADDLMAFLLDRNLPLDDIGARELAEEIVANPPETGYLTISNALQWRLQYGRAIAESGRVDGLHRLRSAP